MDIALEYHRKISFYSRVTNIQPRKIPEYVNGGFDGSIPPYMYRRVCGWVCDSVNKSQPKHPPLVFKIWDSKTVKLYSVQKYVWVLKKMELLVTWHFPCLRVCQVYNGIQIGSRGFMCVCIYDFFLFPKSTVIKKEKFIYATNFSVRNQQLKFV